jgi:hypothetical protein
LAAVGRIQNYMYGVLGQRLHVGDHAVLQHGIHLLPRDSTGPANICQELIEEKKIVAK